MSLESWLFPRRRLSNHRTATADKLVVLAELPRQSISSRPLICPSNVRDLLQLWITLPFPLYHYKDIRTFVIPGLCFLEPQSLRAVQQMKIATHAVLVAYLATSVLGSPVQVPLQVQAPDSETGSTTSTFLSWRSRVKMSSKVNSIP